MRVLGLAFVILGILTLVYSGIRYRRPGAAPDLDPFVATRTGTNKMPLTPIVGGIGVIGGIALLAVPRRRTTAGWFEPSVPSPKPNDPCARAEIDA